MNAKGLAKTLFVFSTVVSAASHPEIRLWPNGAPGSEGMTGQELVEPPTKAGGAPRVSRIHNPSITVYLPAKANATGAAIVVAPGGGHRYLAMHEGYDIGEWLAGRGIAAFVLKYRLAREEGSPYKTDAHPVADAHRAIRTIRHRASEWAVDPARIGIMGFSAGGEVALRASLVHDAGNPSASDPIERNSSRPDFQVLVYPGIRTVALDAVARNTPPAFLICAHDDASPAERIPNVYLALLKAGVPAEMHIYARGGHGYGIRKREMPVSSWSVRAEEWMADMGLLSRK